MRRSATNRQICRGRSPGSRPSAASAQPDSGAARWAAQPDTKKGTFQMTRVAALSPRASLGRRTVCGRTEQRRPPVSKRYETKVRMVWESFLIAAAAFKLPTHHVNTAQGVNLTSPGSRPSAASAQLHSGAARWVAHPDTNKGRFNFNTRIHTHPPTHAPTHSQKQRNTALPLAHAQTIHHTSNCIHTFAFTHTHTYARTHTNHTQSLRGGRPILIQRIREHVESRPTRPPTHEHTYIHSPMSG